VFPFGEPVVFQARVVGVEDSHGNPIESFAAPVTVEGCAFDPGGSIETMEPGREAVVSRPRVFVPPGNLAGVTARSLATVRGLLYRVDGDPADFRSPFTGWEPGIVVNLERAGG
jgi:hypothetical protein